MDYRPEVVTLAEKGARVLEQIPPETLDWLLDGEIPQVSVLVRRRLLGKQDDAAASALWARRNEYAPVAAILDAQRPDGSWDIPSRDYQKYRGSLWQIHLLGELYANPEDERVTQGADYAFSRQMDDGSWSASNMRAAGSIPCLTANVGRALARLGYERDERVVAALKHCVDLRDELGFIDCKQGLGYQLNGYCHMLAPKLLLFMAEVPENLWPEGAGALRDECIARLRDKQVFRCLPSEYTEFGDLLWSAPSSKRGGIREAFLAENPVLHYGPKPGWLRFGYPLSYNSDILESLAALAGVGERRCSEYEEALTEVGSAADKQSRWLLRNSFNDKMYGNVEAKGKPSRWLTLRALTVLEHFSG